MNELLFILYSIVVALTALAALYLGSQALVAYISVLAVLANVFVLKQITLFGWQATASDVLVIGSVLGLNLLHEYFGKEDALRAVWASFLLLVFYTIVSQLHVIYLPSECDFAHTHFFALFQYMPRITIASLVTYFIVQRIDVILYAALRKIWRERFLVFRNVFSISISQLLDTVLFGLLGLYGLIDNLGEVLIVSYVIKLVSLALVGPFIVMSKKINIFSKN